jgi:hypothetical protein
MSRLRELFTIERPPPPTPAVRRLRRLIAFTALATVVVSLVNVAYAEEAGFALTVRTIWGLLRAVGFLFLMRAVRYGRVVSRPFGLILAATTVFAVERLVVPRSGGLLPQWPVIAGFVLLLALCVVIVWQLYRSPEITAHLTRRPPRRPVPAWVLTARVAALSYGALLLVPCLVAAGSLVGDRKLELAYAVPLVAAWFVLSFVVGFVVPWVSLFVIFHKRWARGLLGTVSAVLLVVQPALCWLLLGLDGLIRDGAPMVVAAGLALVALWRTRAGSGPDRAAAGPVVQGQLVR